MKKRKHLRWIIPLAVIVLAAAAWVLPQLTHKLTIGRYRVETNAADSIVIAHISDLHSCRYGKNMEKLITAVDDLSPDIICLTGDIFDDGLPNDNSLVFLTAIAGKYPCFYVSGNHEHRRDPEELNALLTQMQEMGIRLLQNTYELVEIRGQQLCIAGIWGNSRESFIYGFSKELPEDIYTVLLCHYPELTGAYRLSGADVVLCGHAHGGQWRPRSDREGLIAPGQGFFPKYSGGRYELTEKTTMIVSRGLARESHPFIRINNAPEVVEIVLGKGEESRKAQE